MEKVRKMISNQRASNQYCHCSCLSTQRCQNLFPFTSPSWTRTDNPNCADILGLFCLDCYVEHFNSVVLTISSENQNILDAAIEVAFAALLRWGIVFLSHIFSQGVTVHLVLERMQCL